MSPRPATPADIAPLHLSPPPSAEPPGTSPTPASASAAFAELWARPVEGPAEGHCDDPEAEADADAASEPGDAAATASAGFAELWKMAAEVLEQEPAPEPTPEPTPEPSGAEGVEPGAEPGEGDEAAAVPGGSAPDAESSAVGATPATGQPVTPPDAADGARPGGLVATAAEAEAPTQQVPSAEPPDPAGAARKRTTAPADGGLGCAESIWQPGGTPEDASPDDAVPGSADAGSAAPSSADAGSAGPSSAAPDTAASSSVAPGSAAPETAALSSAASRDTAPGSAALDIEASASTPSGAGPAPAAQGSAAPISAAPGSAALSSAAPETAALSSAASRDTAPGSAALDIEASADPPSVDAPASAASREAAPADTASEEAALTAPAPGHTSGLGPGAGAVSGNVATRSTPAGNAAGTADPAGGRSSDPDGAAAGGAPRRRGPADPVRQVMHRHQDLIAGAVDVWEIAAGLEAHGVTDVDARRLRHRDVFGLAEELYARVPRASRIAEAAPERRERAWLHPVGAARYLLPGAVCAVAARFLPAATVTALVLLAAYAVLRGGPLHTRGRPAALWACGLLVLTAPTAPALAVSLLPAAYCAHWFAVRSRAQLTPSHGLDDFADAVRPRLAAALAGYTAVLVALLSVAGPVAAPAALGLLLFSTRLLALHGRAASAAAVLAAACAAEALFRAAAVLGAGGPHGTAQALICAAAAAAAVVQAFRVLPRAAAHRPT